MTIKTLWIMRNGQDVPELLVAVDEFTDEENPAFFEEECENQLKLNDYTEQRIVEIEIPDRDISKHFGAAKIDGKVL